MAHLQVIALDGPGGVGKSSTARALADRLGYFFLSSGSIYRAIAWSALRRGWSRGEPLAEGLLDEVRIDVGAGDALRVDGEPIAERLGSDAISEATSLLSTLPDVRELSNRVQRETVAGIAEEGRYPGVVLEGRDIGTVVFPQARHKFFITASVAVRAERRFAELKRTDPALTLEAVTRALQARDERDSKRAIAPLKPASRAIVIDTSLLSADEVVEAMLREIQGEA